jgi:hypothetical protein
MAGTRRRSSSQSGDGTAGAPATSGKKGAAAAAPKPPEREDTEYVVLRRVYLKGATDFGAVYELPPDADAEALHGALQQGVWVPVVELGRTAQESGKWVPRRIKAPRGDVAIEQVTGKGEGALVGEWKAVAWSAWKGVVRVDPPLTVLQDQRAVSNDE